MYTLERWIHGNVAYEAGGFEETFERDGQVESLTGVHFIRWELESDGVWRIARWVMGTKPSDS